MQTLPRLKWIETMRRYLLPPMLNTTSSPTLSADVPTAANMPSGACYGRLDVTFLDGPSTHVRRPLPC